MEHFCKLSSIHNSCFGFKETLRKTFSSASTPLPPLRALRVSRTRAVDRDRNCVLCSKRLRILLHLQHKRFPLQTQCRQQKTNTFKTTSTQSEALTAKSNYNDKLDSLSNHKSNDVSNYNALIGPTESRALNNESTNSNSSCPTQSPITILCWKRNEIGSWSELGTVLHQRNCLQLF